MSISFNNSLDLPNGLAAQLLVDIGYAKSLKEIIYTHGEMPIEKAREGIEAAKKTATGLARQWIDCLEEEVREIENAGGTHLTWS